MEKILSKLNRTFPFWVMPTVAILMALGSWVQGLQTWQDALQPKYFGALLLAVGGAVMGILSKQPGQSGEKESNDKKQSSRFNSTVVLSWLVCFAGSY